MNMRETDIKSLYTKQKSQFLEPIEKKLKDHLVDTFKDFPRIDRISVRSKDVDRFVAKSQKIDDEGNKKYNDPLNQIQDQLGARIVTFYLSDIEELSKIVTDYFRPIEEQHIIPDSPNEFGYEGRHFILFLPDDIIESEEIKENLPTFFELQIKTLFQHAWGEAEHDLGYKPDTPLTYEAKRKISFTAAQAWGADMIFDELFTQHIDTGQDV